MDASTIVAIVSAGIAIAAAIVAGLQAAKAIKAADRSAAADERAAAAAERANQLAEDQANKYVPKWTLTFDTGSQYILQNDSDRTAFGVILESAAGPNALLLRDDDETRTLAPGDSMSFIATRSSSTRNNAIKLTWHLESDLSGKALERRFALPSRK